jgi:hypothetical protein
MLLVMNIGLVALRLEEKYRSMRERTVDTYAPQSISNVKKG